MAVPIFESDKLIGYFYARIPKDADAEAMLTRAQTFVEEISFAFRASSCSRRWRSSRWWTARAFRRRVLDERLAEEVVRAQTFKTSFCLMLLDIDKFKTLNDTYGHQFGDEVLRRVGEILRGSVYETDFVARYGGEEFAILLPRAEPAGVLRKAEALRKAIESAAFDLAMQRVKVTIALGIAHYPRDGQTADAIVRQADRALYHAKDTGRNRAVDVAESHAGVSHPYERHPDDNKPQDLAGLPAEPPVRRAAPPAPSGGQDPDRALRRVALAAGVLLMRPPPRAPGGEDLAQAPKGLLSTAKKEYVGVVQIDGAIFQQDGGGVWAKGSSAWGRRLERLGKKSEVKAIVLSINSPGGSVGSVQELHALLARIRTEHKKPVVAQLGDVAASGGYYLAVACDKIVAHPGTLVGSIGVIFNTMNVEGLMAKLGVKQSPIKSGKMKDIGSMSRPMTEEERALLQSVIDNAYGQFLTAVADGRKMTVETVRPFADGRIVTGEQALKLGFVDELGDSWHAVQLAGRLGGITGSRGLPGGQRSRIMDILESRLAFLRGPDLAVLGRLGAFEPVGLESRSRP